MHARHNLHCPHSGYFSHPVLLDNCWCLFFFDTYLRPSSAARLAGYAQQQQPDFLHQVFAPGGPPGSAGAKLAVAGIAALAAKNILGGGGQDGDNFF